ncbi:MAG: ester cyclase [Candidatus Dormibacteraeota bacterium]|nr:ester cyclase [Candidatus Dormibacteraeota bacterium]
MAEAKEMARRDIELFNQGKLEEVVNGWAENVEFESPLSGPLKGRESVKAYWKQTRESFPDMKVQVRTMVGEGTRVAVEYTVTGTNTGSLKMPTGETIPATNKKVTLPGLDISEAGSDAKLKSLHQYFDAMGIMRQLGLVPAEASTRA